MRSVLSEPSHDWGRLVSGLPSGSTVQMVSYSSIGEQVIAVETDTPVEWDQLHDAASYSEGITGLVLDNNKTKFTCTSQTSMVLLISGFVGWSVDEATTSSRNVFLVKNGQITGNWGRHSHAVAAAGDNVPTSPITSILYLEPDDFFHIYAWHNSPSGSQSLNALSDFPGSRLSILRLV